MNMKSLPFDDFRTLMMNLPGPNQEIAAHAQKNNQNLKKPQGSLGRIETIAMWLAAWTGRPPAVNRPLVAIFAGNHGISRHGITPLPTIATQKMVKNFSSGGAAINQICMAYDLGLKVFDLALDYPTDDITENAALSERDCAATMAFGMESVAGQTDLLCIGEVGIGNTTIAAAINYALYGGSVEDWIGASSESNKEILNCKLEIVKKAVAFHRNHLSDPFELMRRLGGREIAAMAGAILAARIQRIPVIIDGYASTAAASILKAINPSALDHCLLGHLSKEPGHLLATTFLGKTPLLSLEMCLGEGTGAALAAGIVKAAAACHSGMSTFSKDETNYYKNSSNTEFSKSWGNYIL
ncbi:Nicotinate-nucleotide--dimethylbenzimidazole phosphoribosyltransferase [Liberibacter crescens BT-1]|uniref:Nicotinate-nucleotide--dimethylbenzimidazole phosphoribosyltransferase n=1 Tax=Liberibacter crescens (strain BT-1) TaxID=1215343 RepID=L0EWB0_LIBCB|nr:nicotinate-nucleotide--dimethylbenzimidazole phosphoribosyltransferase [Liberibacter crescens]AGA65247.1 Nicotinate-nucleotide--dimethylbenzimidazole phosphoribosyltransferase [Liberibacter crescens BT-1]